MWCKIWKHLVIHHFRMMREQKCCSSTWGRSCWTSRQNDSFTDRTRACQKREFPPWLSTRIAPPDHCPRVGVIGKMDERVSHLFVGLIAGWVNDHPSLSRNKWPFNAEFLSLQLGWRWSEKPENYRLIFSSSNDRYFESRWMRKEWKCFHSVLQVMMMPVNS